MRIVGTLLVAIVALSCGTEDGGTTDTTSGGPTSAATSTATGSESSSAATSSESSSSETSGGTTDASTSTGGANACVTANAIFDACGTTAFFPEDDCTGSSEGWAVCVAQYPEQACFFAGGTSSVMDATEYMACVNDLGG